MDLRWRGIAGRAVYRVGGWLIHVKTYQRMYEMRNADLDPRSPGDSVEFVPIRRSWETIGWAWDLLELSEVLDPAHWEHWAIDHGAPTLDGTICPRCPVCGGGTCGDGPGDAWGHTSPVTDPDGSYG